MKKTLFSLFLFSGLLSYGQMITLEHTYTEAPVTRVNLGISGEKYYLLDPATITLKLFNADHTLWKTIPLPVSESTMNITIASVSETKINPDLNVEVAFTYFYADGNNYYSDGMVLSEDGTVLLELGNTNYFVLSEIQGLPTKLIAVGQTDMNSGLYNSTVFSIPALSSEHNYPGESYRIKLDNFGEKYHYLDKVAEAVQIYNSDHTFWKTISLPKPASAEYGGVNFVNDHQVNDDNQLEIGFGYYFPGENITYESKIVNENSTLLTLPGVSGTYVSMIEGVPNKIIAIFSGDTFIDSRVYSVPDLSLENTYYSTLLIRTKLEVSGEKYYNVFLNGDTADLYNADHTLWKSIPTVYTAGALNNYDVNHISENKINGDNLVEMSYSAGNSGINNCYVINENGSVLGNVSGASSLFLSEIPGAENKFIASYTIPNAYGAVYALGSLGTTDFQKNKITVYPNPVSDILNIQAETLVKQADFYDCRGILVQQKPVSGITKIDVCNLADGIYLLRLTDVNDNKSVHKIIVSH